MRWSRVLSISKPCFCPSLRRQLSLQTGGVMSESFVVDNLSRSPRSAILRYASDQDKFQLKLTHNNKVFNFERATSETLQTFKDRMVANISKKLKDRWDGRVSILTEDGQSWKEVGDHGVSVSNLMEHVLKNGKSLAIQVSENLYDVSINPPEVLSIKFLKQVVAGFPVIPYKIETSSNFQRDASLYKWEYSHEPKGAVGKNKKKKNPSHQEEDMNNDGWKDTGCSSYAFTPGEDLVGTRLRFTCTPSNGRYFGLEITEEVPEVVQQPPVTRPLYMERLGQMEEYNNCMPGFLRVISYNCLAECYATEEWFVASPKSALPGDFRLPFLCQELLSYHGDLYCLQEIEDKYFERIFQPFLELSLKLKGFMSTKIGNVKEGVAMFYNPRKLEPIRNETVVICEHMRTMAMWNKLDPIIVNRLEDRNSVLQVSIFKTCYREDMIMLVANTHLYFHPDADHIRLLQTIACVDYVEGICSEIQKNFPQVSVGVLFCGDFNCTPPFSSFRYLTAGNIQEDDYDWTSHPTEKLTPGISARHNLQLRNSHPNHELTNITSNFEGCIDYILYQPQHFSLAATYPPPDKEKLSKLLELPETRLVSLPNFYTPSDHLPLIADFVLSPTD